MAKEGSVAPKERVNIVYRPSIGDAKEEVELPLKLLILGDYTGREDDRMMEDRKSINVDKDNFNEVLKEQNIGVNINVPNKIADDDEGDLGVKLKFDSIKDFDPESIVKQTPEMNKLLELRSALTSLKSPMSNVPGFRKKIQAIFDDKDMDGVEYQKLLKELGIEK